MIRKSLRRDLAVERMTEHLCPPAPSSLGRHAHCFTLWTPGGTIQYKEMSLLFTGLFLTACKQQILFISYDLYNQKSKTENSHRLQWNIPGKCLDAAPFLSYLWFKANSGHRSPVPVIVERSRNWMSMNLTWILQTVNTCFLSEYPFHFSIMLFMYSGDCLWILQHFLYFCMHKSR